MIDIPSFEDEILYWEDWTDVNGDFMTDRTILTFGDGSSLEMRARVRIPRSPDLTPSEWNGAGTISDNGLGEAYELVDQSTAVRIMRKLMLANVIIEMPERDKMECPRCHGDVIVNNVLCDVCEGRGEVLRTQ